MDIKEIQEIIKAQNIDTLRIEYPDLYGVCRHKVMPVKHLEAVVEEGLAFAQAIYAIHLGNDVAPETGCGYEIEWKDMTLVPDLNTFAILPYLDGTARLICNAYRDGELVGQETFTAAEDFERNDLFIKELQHLFREGLPG